MVKSLTLYKFQIKLAGDIKLLRGGPGLVTTDITTRLQQKECIKPINTHYIMGEHRKKCKTSKSKTPGPDGVGGSTKPSSPSPPPVSTNSGWTRPPNISQRFNLLLRKDIGDLTIAHLNVEKIGRFKRKELADILSKYDIDCLGIVEHQLGSNDYDENPSVTRVGYKSLQIKGYKVASKHRDRASGGVAWYWKNDLNVEIWVSHLT